VTLKSYRLLVWPPSKNLVELCHTMLTYVRVSKFGGGNATLLLELWVVSSGRPQ